MNSGPAWTSMSTGLNPGRHGIYGLVGFAEGSYRVRPLNRSDQAANTVWDRLGKNGKQAVVMNLPMTYPAMPVNGALVAGGDAPGPESPQFTYPEELIDEINIEAGKYMLSARLDGLIRANRKAEALEKLYRMIDTRTRAALFLMKRQAWDLFLVLFTASDQAQHYFWKDLAGGPFQDAILSVFRRLDTALGALTAKTGPDTATIVLSDHGAGPAQPALRYLNDFLAALGLLKLKQRGPLPWNSLLRWAFLQLDRRLSDRAKSWLVERFSGFHESARASLLLENVDWTNTRAFNLVGSSEIWVNLRGRFPGGIVSPGEEYEEVVELIRTALVGAADVATGKPAVKAVHRRDEIYDGPFLDQAPDLLVEWTEEPAESGLRWQAERQRVVAACRTAHRPYLISGQHRKAGIFVASGPPFASGTSIKDATLLDVTPTLLYILDQPVPRNLDGRVLTGALADHWLEEHLPQLVDEEPSSLLRSEVSVPVSRDDEVVRRLRALGYIE
jgi:predicted AlkP superfamily phosphohydrolase/phosphomutase